MVIRFIGDKYCERIAHKLRNDLVKTDVQLRGNYIGCQGAVAIADMLRVNGTIRSLSLEWNDIGEEEEEEGGRGGGSPALA